MPAGPTPAAATVRFLIRAVGLVQGVGFRPFVYRVATRSGLAGVVRNTSGGAEIEAEGSREQIDALLQALRDELPAIARIDQLDVTPQPLTGETGFRIVESSSKSEAASLISPDVATCADCLAELRDPADRRHRYPFVNCTNCGPRFTIVEAVPYDRHQTTMRPFELCPSCAAEYRDPADRRFHAEPNACPVCGPRVELLDAAGRSLATGDAAIDELRSRLAAGAIAAIKGLGGFHLACDACNAEAVATLRQRKTRPHKPLAVMVADLDVARQCCDLDASEERELCSPRRPILLLLRRRSSALPIADGVAPGRADLGVMLPYTPLHHLLFMGDGPRCLVMTSGNRSEEPIVIDNQQAVSILGHIADVLLVHDRAIWNRCDDSVGYVADDQLVLTRRSRGHVPLPVKLPHPVRPTLAVGPWLTNTFAWASGDRAYLSQHIGDVDNSETLDFLIESIGKLQRWLGIEPELIAHDLHPDYLTTRLAHELGETYRRVPVQHHHAHLIAACAAAGIDRPVQGLVLDGTGYGYDRTIWGGELLVGDARSFRRAAHLVPLPLPGGDAAIRRPLRTAIAYLHKLVPDAAKLPLALWSRASEDELTVVRQMVDRGFNCTPTSSAGRLFDAVSALLGVCDQISFEGQAAIELEQLAWRGVASRAPALQYAVGVAGDAIGIDVGEMFEQLVQALLDGVAAADLAAAFHADLARLFADVCAVVADDSQTPREVVLCGGVFQNRLLTRLVAQQLTAHKLRAIVPGAIPVNDGGIALGQILVANAAADAAATPGPES